MQGSRFRMSGFKGGLGTGYTLLQLILGGLQGCPPSTPSAEFSSPSLSGGIAWVRSDRWVRPHQGQQAGLHTLHKSSKCPLVVSTFPIWKPLSGVSPFLPTYLTESVKSPGLLLLGLAKKLPSTPLVSSRFSASTPVIFGWNHLERERESNEQQDSVSTMFHTITAEMPMSRVANKNTNQTFPAPSPSSPWSLPLLAVPSVGPGILLA